MFLAGKNPPYLIGPNYGTTRYVYGNPAERLYGQQGTSARTWYTVDALGSVRAVRNDAGVPQAVASYDAWGVPETPLLGSFGCTGEVQQGADVWLRARWYGAARGGFASRDPYAGNAQTPYSMMPYQYGYSNPVQWTDASGMRVSPGDGDGASPCRRISQPTQTFNDQTRWTGDEIALSQCFAPVIFKYAAFHAVPGAGFDKNTMAALMAAIIQMENGNPTWDDMVNRNIGYVTNTFIPPLLNDAYRHVTTKNLPGYNASVGIANIRPEVVAQIYNCTTPMETAGKPVLQTSSEPQLVSVRAMADLRSTVNWHIPPGTPYGQDDYHIFAPLLGSAAFSIEMLAINLKRGVLRAQAEGLTPSILNLATWHNSGIQHPHNLMRAGTYRYGVVVATIIYPRAARNLGIPLSKTPIYNALLGDPRDEQPLIDLVRCGKPFCMLH